MKEDQDSLLERGQVSDLADFAKTVIKHLREHFPLDGEQDRQVLCLAEETGEFVGAFRRWSGQARRDGTFGEMADELADVVITAYVAAEALNIDLDNTWRIKAEEITTRGWREATTKTRGDRDA